MRTSRVRNHPCADSRRDLRFVGVAIVSATTCGRAEYDQIFAYARRVRLVAIAVILAVSSPAHADEQAAMEDYFAGEITGGWVLTGMGVAGLTTGGILLAADGDRMQGASYVAFGFGAAHLAAGVYINIASRVRRRVYTVAIARARTPWLELERARMKGVSKTFLVLEIAEVVLIAGGGTMAAIGHTKDRPQLEGAGYALAVEAAATLLFDIVASRRAHRYQDRLGESVLDVGMTTDVAGAPVLLVGPTLRF
jgi:hypothetical protein